VFRVGIIVFAQASVAGGFAPNETALLAARVVQGCGAALGSPAALSVLAATFPAGPARDKAVGIYGAMAGLGSVVGLLLGRHPRRATRAPGPPNPGGALRRRSCVTGLPAAWNRTMARWRHLDT
jgi:hypothetical protein